MDTEIFKKQPHVGAAAFSNIDYILIILFKSKRGDFYMKVISTQEIYKSLTQYGDYGFVMNSEEKFHDLIMSAIRDILQTIDSKRVVFLAGPSGSGKTTTANRIKNELENYGVPVLRISMDDYFLSLIDRKEVKSFEDPRCVDMELLKEHIPMLLDGREVRSPRYNFVRGTSELGSIISLPKNGVIICEGIHALNSELFNEFKGMCRGIYVAPRTRVSLGNEIFSPQELRLARRILRDSALRGKTPSQVITQSISVDEGEKQYIDPFKEKASIHIDTFLEYELCVIAYMLSETNKIEQIDDSSLLHKILLSIPRINPKCVPQDSILREFIGGICHEK